MKKMTVKAFNEKMRKITTEAMDITMSIEASVVMSGDVEKLIKLDAAVWYIIRGKLSYADYVECARQALSKKMQDIDTEMVEVNDDWGPEYEEGGSWIRPKWFCDWALDATQALYNHIKLRLDDVRLGHPDDFEFAESDLECLRRLCEEVPA